MYNKLSHFTALFCIHGICIWRTIEQCLRFKVCQFNVLNSPYLNMGLGQITFQVIAHVNPTMYILSYHSNLQKSESLPLFFHSRKCVQVHSSPCCSVPGPSHFHQVHGCSAHSTSYPKLFGRLVNMCPYQRTGNERYRGGVGTHPQASPTLNKEKSSLTPSTTVEHDSWCWTQWEPVWHLRGSWCWWRAWPNSG